MEIKKRIALDKSVLYALVKWHNIQEYDYNGVVQTLYKDHKLMPSKLKSTDLSESPLMQDGWIRRVWVDKKGDRHFRNLEGIIEIYKACMRGEMEINIVPTILQGVIYDLNKIDGENQKIASLGLQFIQQNTKVLSAKEEDYDEFFELRRKLCQQYLDAGIFWDTQLPQACALAESAIFGLHYLVKDENLYIHQNWKNGDCIKMKKIAAINQDNGLTVFDKHSGAHVVPKVWLPSFLMLKNNEWKHGALSYNLWVDSTSINNGEYVAKNKR